MRYPSVRTFKKAPKSSSITRLLVSPFPLITLFNAISGLSIFIQNSQIQPLLNMSGLKPIILHSHQTGPNPWKVAIILEELGLPYEHKFVHFPDIKKEPYISVNPNGRVPAIEDPNTGITIWESGAIIEYLVDEYDTTEKISYKSKPEKYYLKQWLHFQVSGQGPYFGQAVWFDKNHVERIPSAVQRYRNEAKRVTSVLNTVLAKKEYLVGDKATYADLSFVPWFQLLPLIFHDENVDWAGEYPHFHAWFEKLQARPSVQKVVEDKKAAIANK